MKINFLGFVLCALLFVSCKESTKDCPPKCEDLSCYSNNNRPDIAITYEEMAAMFETYDKGAKKVLNAYTKKESKGKDSISTISNWYKLDDLKQYIAYLEKISKEKNIKLTGIKIYPASYPKHYKKKEYAGRQTLIFTPTTTINGRDDVAFEPLYSEEGNPVSIDVFLNQVRNGKVNEASFLPTLRSQSLESSAANRGQINPPY